MKAIPLVLFICPFILTAQEKGVQDKGIPPSTPLRTWDVRYDELEPRLERQLADDPESLAVIDELARVFAHRASMTKPPSFIAANSPSAKPPWAKKAWS